MKQWILLFLISFSLQPIFAQTDISVARSKSIGSTVEIQGIVTNGNELGRIRYLQDETAGIAVYVDTDSDFQDFLTKAKRGFTVKVKGVLKEYENLLEIDPILSYEIVSNSVQDVEPQLVTAFQIKESNEGKLVTLENVSIENFGSYFRRGITTITQGSRETQIFIPKNHPVIGRVQPNSLFHIVGIVSQYKDTYQIIPRDYNDVVFPPENMNFIEPPKFDNSSTNQFAVEYEVTGAEFSRFYVYDIDKPDDLFLALSFRVTEGTDFIVNGLKPGHIYKFQACTINPGYTDTICYPDRYVATRSTYNTSVDVLFNSDSYEKTNVPLTEDGQAMLNYVVNQIQSARSSVDASLYNIDDNAIVDALNNVHRKGVRVRYVTDANTSNLGLKNAEFPVVKGNGKDALMHNKFFIIDGEKVITGSTNWTNSNIYDDHNNTIIIRNPLVARTYKAEMDEMWGSMGGQADLVAARFGNNKVITNPTELNLSNLMVETYFSPTDRTLEGILTALDKAKEEVIISMLTCTADDLVDKLIELSDRGVRVRMIIDDSEADGSDYEYLLDNGIEIYDHQESHTNHNKYCIIDPRRSSGFVITGSYNWTSSAEEKNDENTIIIYDSNIAKVYAGEFESVWCEVSGLNCVTSTNHLQKEENWSLYPSVTDEVLQVHMPLLNKSEEVVYEIRSSDGRLIWARSQGQIEENTSIEVSFLQTGSYLLTWRTPSKFGTKYFVKK